MRLTPFNGKLPVEKEITKNDFNELMLENIGLVEDEYGFLMDDDLGMGIIIRGKRLVIDSEHPALKSKEALMFDPAGNPSIMDKLFKYYVGKHDDETGVPTRTIAYGSASKNEKSYIEIIKADGTVYRSELYFNDNIKCGDLIIKLNSTSNPHDFKKLDRDLYEASLKALEAGNTPTSKRSKR